MENNEINNEIINTAETNLSKNEIKAAIEAILFSFGDAVSINKIASALEMDKKDLKPIIGEMIEEYDNKESGIRIVALEDSYQMCSKEKYYDYLIKIKEQPKKNVLTDVLLETLSIIAYKQPITRIEIEKIRGVSSDHAVNRLVEYNLVKELGRLDAPGRPLLFGTTEEFLRSFGVQSIDELPVIKPDQIEAFKAEAQEEMNTTIEDVEI